jgi:hypothetical protein
MEKEFIPYAEALALKELGCYLTFETIEYHKRYYVDSGGNETSESYIKEVKKIGILYQQAFRWFREKYGLYYYITTHDETDFEWYVYDKYQNEWEDDTTQTTYEEAELECLRKLIEIVKTTK